MFLSRLILNPRNAQVRREVAFPYQLHRTLLNAFPNGKFKVDRSTDDSAGVLFRLEEYSHENRITVLVQSRTTPDWRFLDGKKDAHGQPYLLSTASILDGKPNPAVTELDLAQKLHPGQALAFRLRANPTKRLGKSAGKDQGKRVGIYDEGKQIEWLHRKAEAGGFRIIQVRIGNDGKLKDTIHRKNAEDEELELFSIQFDGLLQVLDSTKLAETVTNGIGSGKSFGFGLLSLAPAS